MSNRTRRVLIADDHDVVRTVIRALLTARSDLHIVAEAKNGREALEEARVTKPDITITDYSLYELNGIDLTLILNRKMQCVEVFIRTAHDREVIALN